MLALRGAGAAADRLAAGLRRAAGLLGLIHPPIVADGERDAQGRHVTGEQAGTVLGSASRLGLGT